MKLHLIGICGTGMGAVAGLLKASGHEVRGSDEHVYPPMSTQLDEMGVHVYHGFSGDNLSWMPDAVVVGNVCRKDHIEVEAARRAGIRLASFPGILEELLLPGKTTLVVTGTHGKTTTSAMAAWVLKEGGLDPSYLVGGVPLNLPAGYGLGSGPFVIEGDEYDTAFFDKKSKFLHYRPKVAILTSIELDHVDIFANLDQIKDSFREFVSLIPEDGLLLVCASSKAALEVAASARCQVKTYGLSGTAEGLAYRAEPCGNKPGGRTLFHVYEGETLLQTFDTGLPGAYNLENAVAVIAACRHLGVELPALTRAVRLFSSVRRRQELRGLAQGVAVIDDFAHHPTAIEKTLRGLRGRFGSGRLVAVFEPRSATSRTSVFQKEFAEALAVADEVLLGPVHMPEKAPEGKRLDTEAIAGEIRRRGVPARAYPGVTPIVEHLGTTVAAGDTVVIMSSGSFEGLHEQLLRRLGEAVVPAEQRDLGQILDLLQTVKLPIDGLNTERNADLMVIHDGDGRVIGCVGLEIYGDAALLRSLAVRPERRGEGLGWMLAEAALLRARMRGMRTISLLTEHATDFFAANFGFLEIPRERVPEAVQSSTEFRIGRCRNAVAMQREI